MTERYGFFKKLREDGRERGKFGWLDVFSSSLNDGILEGDSKLAVSATSPATMSVNVGTGGAWLQKYWYRNDVVKNLAIRASHATLHRIDRIVIRLLFRRDVTLTSDTTLLVVVKEGTPHATPTPPALTRNVDMFEMSLAQVHVDAAVTSIAAGRITDERRNGGLCGDAYPNLKTRAVVALADAATTLTSTQMIDDGIFTMTPTVARTVTTPTGADIIAGFPGFRLGDWFEFTIVNLVAATNAITLAAGASGVILVGATAVAAATSGTFRALITSPTTVVIYRI